jgi:Trp operon repressor
MVQISKARLDDRVLDKIFDLFFKVMASSSDKKLFKLISEDIFSPTERIMIAKRITIMYLVLRGINQRTISQVLRVSSATVAKFAILTEKSHGITQALEKTLMTEDLKDSLLGIFNSIFPPGTYGINWKAAWERKKIYSRKKTQGI